MKDFISKNRVFLSGLLSAIMLVLQQFLQAGPVSWKAFGLAIIVTILSYVANEWKAKTASILGIIGAVSSAIVLQLQSGRPLNWAEVGIVLAMALLGYFSEGLRAPENREHIPNQ